MKAHSTLLQHVQLHSYTMQDVEIVVQPIPRFVSNWLIGIGKLLSTLIKLKVTGSVLASPSLAGMLCYPMIYSLGACLLEGCGMKSCT